MNTFPVVCKSIEHRNLKSQTNVHKAVQPSFGMTMKMPKMNTETKVNDSFTKKAIAILVAMLSFFGLKKLNKTGNDEQPVTIQKNNLQHKQKGRTEDPKHSAKMQRRTFLNEQRKKIAIENELKKRQLMCEKLYEYLLGGNEGIVDYNELFPNLF